MNKRSTVDNEEVKKFEQLALTWWDASGPLKTLHDINPARLSFIEQYVTLDGKRVLDVGCGGGILSEAMTKRKADVIGLDVAQESIGTAAAHARQENLQIDYVCTPLEEFQASAFEVITCMEMLEHVPEPSVIIEECVRLLKPGGYLFLSTINRTVKAYASAIIAAEYLLGIIPRQTHEYKKFIKPSELAHMVREQGLQVKGLSGMSYNPFTRQADLCASVSVNYLLACCLPE